MTPRHYCECGCGEKTSGSARRPSVRFIRGHVHKKNTPEYVEEDRGYATPCWIWQRYKNPLGYGRVYRERAHRPAHRWFYEKAKGPIPDGLVIDHLCRVPSCVNPDHLEPVEVGENTRRGLHTKLTPEIVAALRAEHAAGASLRGLARKYGLSYSGLRNAVLGINWAHIS